MLWKILTDGSKSNRPSRTAANKHIVTLKKVLYLCDFEAFEHKATVRIKKFSIQPIFLESNNLFSTTFARNQKSD